MTTATDPLLAALIAKLPPGGSLWPVKKRVAWLHMLWMSLDVVYEADAGETIELPAFLGPAAAASAPSSIPPSESAAMTQPAKPVPTSLFAFVIDREGYARRANGDRVMPGHVTDIIHDLRGEADLGSIIWADDSAGVRGLTLDVTPA